MSSRRRMRLFGGALSILLAGVLGAAAWQHELDQQSLKAAGEDSLVASLRARGVTGRDVDIHPKASRRTERGQAEVQYEIQVERDSHAEPKATGRASIPMRVALQETGSASSMGFKRPVWQTAQVSIDRSGDFAEQMWTRLEDEPENVQFDNGFMASEPNDGSYVILEIAAALRLGEHRRAAQLIENSTLWTSDIVWTPTWAKRLQGEMIRFQGDLDTGKVRKADVKIVKRALHHFAVAPQLASFREDFARMLNS